MPDPAGEAATALVWLTRLPLGRFLPRQAPALARAAWAFPLAGLAVALPAGGLIWVAAALGLPPLAWALLALAATAWLTGALHEDGLADFADGCGSPDRARALEIMRDSRVGSYGVIALLLSFGLRAAALAAMAPAAAAAALVGAAALSRAGMAAGLAFLPPARPEGLGRLAGRASAGQALAAAAIGAAVLAWPAARDGQSAGAWLAALACCAAAQLVVARSARRRLGGQTGDVLGAMQQAGEIGALLALAAT
ncbi:cobalamin-5'-phosphate synthase [Paracoccus aminovorans]|uniref:Adenosylcobinamide-GDP ribazoletransferase n=1 Tax=Paracoccus aminovorans TaxID=34004 RepID=A0A1I3BRV4_9RHOB|nr:adenosylcobinamide-GDP ribazoletransferase [Paracoccus aminovorans]CQR86227.1 cobalamin synthase [Paracoccus aminovorans]SFH64910.1 cobalamin-5'-phosphate synthase [Paracoccus aminovorans]